MKKLGILLVATLVLISTQLYSQPVDGHGYKKIMKDLKLTETQKKDVDKIRLDMEKQQIAQKAKNETARLELQQLFKADTPDKSAIEKKMNEIASLEVQSHMLRVDSWFAINTLLTPEQQKTWKKVLEAGPAIAERKMGHHEMGKGRMPQHPDAPPQK
jgi:Spy/CpxP family protein refolding chaperone